MDEEGEITAIALIFTVAILLVGGFTVDAGRGLSARRELNDVASQAARAAAQEIDRSAAAEGFVRFNDQAVPRGQDYLAGQGVQGAVSIDGDTVNVQTTGNFQPVMFFGFGNRTVTGEGTSRGVRGDSSADS